MGSRLSARKRFLLLVAIFVCCAFIYKFSNFSNQTVSSQELFKPLGGDLFHDLPKITLFVRTTFSKPDLRSLGICELFRTAALYWSRKLGPVRIVLDDNSPEDHRYAKLLVEHQDALQQDVSVRFEFIPQNNKILHMSSMPIGYNVQIYSSLFIDLYVDTEAVAWVDTDAAFTTPVTIENIINNGKLIVKGIPVFKRPHERGWDDAVKIMLGHRFVTNFMTYFPMFIWKDTIKNCREFIIKRHNASIADVLWTATMRSGYSPCPVCVIMTYAYYFERNRYDWHIDTQNDLATFNKEHITPGHELRPEDTKPEIHLTIHSKHSKSRSVFNHFLNTYCPLTRHIGKTLSDRVASLCEEYKSEWPTVFFIFQNGAGDEVDHMKTWCLGSGLELCKEVVRKHLENVKRYIQNGVYDLDISRTKKVENLTSVFGGQCEPLF